MILRIFVGFLLLSLCSCNEKKPLQSSYFNIDSLISTQTQQLAMKAASVSKTVAINDLEETLVMKPDSASWAHELGIFKQLEMLNKPIHAAVYGVTDGVKDSHSNLKLRIYHATQQVSIKEFKFYYQDRFEKLRRIEAASEESNALYLTERKFVLTFDNQPEGLALRHYAVSGFQKMILGDTVRFSLSAEIIY